MQKINCYICDLCRKIIGYGVDPDNQELHMCQDCIKKQIGK